MTYATNHLTITVTGPENAGQSALVKLIYEVLKDEFHHIRVATENLDQTMGEMLVEIDAIKEHTALFIQEETILPPQPHRPPVHNPAPPPAPHHGGNHGHGPKGFGQ